MSAITEAIISGAGSGSGALENLARGLSSGVSKDSVIRLHEPLAKRTTLRVGGPADIYAEPAAVADLRLCIKLCEAAGFPWVMLGRGSNLLVRDGGIRGVVICLARGEFVGIQIEGCRIKAGAGARLKHVAVEARRASIGGLEFLEGIPGSVGGALRMNAGAMGAAIFDRLETVSAMDRCGRIAEHSASSLAAGYRHCAFFRDHIALSAVLKGYFGDVGEIEGRMRALNSKRWETQPAAPSAGCIFKNPDSIPAGRLIEELGLKGKRVGGAQISELHGNFFVNDGSATARDVLALIEMVQKRAMEERQIPLETEVQIVGEEEASCV